MPAKKHVPKPVGPPPEITDVDVAFPSHAMDWLPAWEDIPEEFKGSGNPWAQKVGYWFFKGPEEAWIGRIVPKEGIDRNKALKVIQACLGSYAPKHEHKIAGTAYMLATWFTDPELKGAS
jgi:hypothetical protein